jgi:hypothetical protein
VHGEIAKNSYRPLPVVAALWRRYPKWILWFRV